MLADAELKTAEEPPTGQSVLQLAAAYKRAGLESEALGVLRRAQRFGIPPKEVLPPLLAELRRRQRFPELDAALKAGLGIADRSIDLRREIALGLAAMGKQEGAAAEWAALVGEGAMTEADWHDCARFMLQGNDVPALADKLQALAQAPLSKRSAAASYCLLRACVGRDRAAALRLLAEMSIEAMPLPELILDVGILAFRLGDLGSAESAAARALQFPGVTALARSLLATLRSFGGDPSLLPPGRVFLPPNTMDQVANAATGVASGLAACGFISYEGEAQIQFELSPEAVAVEWLLPVEIEAAATFSILSEEPYTDPCLVLTAADWSCPHLLLQRVSGKPRFHVFVESPGHRDWFWEEVRPDLHDSEVPPPSASPVDVSSLWGQALEELNRRTGEMKKDS